MQQAVDLAERVGPGLRALGGDEIRRAGVAGDVADDVEVAVGAVGRRDPGAGVGQRTDDGRAEAAAGAGDRDAAAGEDAALTPPPSG